MKESPNSYSSCHSKVLSTGLYLPEKIVTNEMLEQFPESVRKLIEVKTGVRERRVADECQSTSHLGIEAARDCLDKACFDPSQLDAVIVSTSSPDRIQPATATRIQHEIAARNAFAFDINSVCSGSVYGMALSDALIKAKTCKNVLLIASEVYSRILNPSDFSTFPYFGDGAAAVLITESCNENTYIRSLLKTDGSGADVIQIPGGGTMMPFSAIKKGTDIYFQMQGKEVYSFAVEKGTEVINEITSRYEVDKGEIKYIVPHQANVNIIRDIARKTEIPINKFIMNLDKYGNTASASVLIGLDELFKKNTIQKGDLILTVAFGGGLSWGANLISI